MLFRSDPLLALECACRIQGRQPPAADEVILIDRSDALPRPSRANGSHRQSESEVHGDLLFSVHRRNPDGSIGEAIEFIWIVEVQLHRDLSRAQAWSDAITAAAREFGVAPANVVMLVVMLVVSPDPHMRAWLRHRLFPRMKLRPHLLTRSHVPRLYSLQSGCSRSAGRPAPPVLSATFHGRDPRNLAVVRTALAAIAPLEFSDPILYREAKYLISESIGKAMTDQFPSLHDQASERIIELDDDEDVPQWEFEGMTWGMIRERIIATSREEGIQQGIQQGALRARREALLAMLALRDLVPTPDQHVQIERCDDAARLAAWMAQVKEARQVADVLAVPSSVGSS